MSLNPLNAIGNAVTGLFGWGEEYTKGKNEVKLKKIAAKAENQIRTLDNKHSWEITAMQSAMYLRWCIVFHMFVGMDASIYLALIGDPEPMKIMNVLNELPVYYQGFIATIIGFAFGSEPLKNVGARAAAQFVNFREKRK